MTLDLNELSDEEVQAVLDTPAFQKAAKYRRLAHGLDALQDDDAIRQQLVASITSQHSTIGTTGSVEEVLDLFVDEVETYTKGLGVEPSDDGDPLDELVVDATGRADQ